jgi:hypothetical protein
MKIENVEKLEQAYPEAVAEIRREAGIDSGVYKSTAKDRKRALELATVIFGDDANGLVYAVQNNLNVEQVKGIQMAMEKEIQSSEAEAVQSAKNEMLRLIMNAGSENPGAGFGMLDLMKNYLALVSEYMAVHNCKKGTAMMAVAQTHPKAHDAYLKSVNRNRV